MLLLIVFCIQTTAEGLIVLQKRNCETSNMKKTHIIHDLEDTKHAV